MKETMTDAIKDAEQKLEKANFHQKYTEPSSINTDGAATLTEYNMTYHAKQLKTQKRIKKPSGMRQYEKVSSYTNRQMQLNHYGNRNITTPAWNDHPSNDHHTKWEYHSTNQYGTYSNKYGHNVMRSYTTLIVLQAEQKQQAQKNGYYDTNNLKQIYFHQTTTASSVTQKLS